jgi:hypothetical protein
VVQGDNTLKASLNDLLAPNYALLGDFQNTMAEAVGYSAAARRFVGITVPLLGAPSDGGNANGWHLPAQPRAMIYDIIFLSMTAPGTAQLVVWTAANADFRRAQIIALPALVAGHQAVTQKVYARRWHRQLRAPDRRRHDALGLLGLTQPQRLASDRWRYR